MAHRLKVLVSSYACNPRRGSESGVGWGWVNAIARQHDVWVLTAEQNRSDIEAEVAAHPQQYRSMQFRYVPRMRWLALERVWPPSYLWTYELWQRAAYRAGAALHEEVGFDLVHLVTYVTFRSPGHLWKLGVPFVWGPIGALENTPWRYLPMMGLRGCLYYAARNVINSLHKRFLPGPKRAFRRAVALIAATSGIRKEIRAWYGRESEVICEIGPPPEAAEAITCRGKDEPLRLAWSGQHLPGKALPLLLNALSRMDASVRWTLDILGEGSCTRRWRQSARRLGIDDRCTWHGWVPRDQALSIVHKSHVFVITSLKDLTSTVLLEALSQGVPVVCPDHCGFADVVTAECGIKVSLFRRRQFESEVAAEIVKLAGDEQERRRLAEGAVRRIQDFSWEGKAERLNALYAACTGARWTEPAAAAGCHT